MKLRLSLSIQENDSSSTSDMVSSFNVTQSKSPFTLRLILYPVIFAPISLKLPALILPSKFASIIVEKSHLSGIVSEYSNDTLESIMSKYKVHREELEDYNDLNNLMIGTKIIIPTHYE